MGADGGLGGGDRVGCRGGVRLATEGTGGCRPQERRVVSKRALGTKKQGLNECSAPAFYRMRLFRSGQTPIAYVLLFLDACNV